jgi:hypothetical protein
MRSPATTALGTVGRNWLDISVWASAPDDRRGAGVAVSGGRQVCHRRGWVVAQRTSERVELHARAADCPQCGGTEVRVKDRPLVRVRDLPIAGRLTRLAGRCGAL